MTDCVIPSCLFSVLSFLCFCILARYCMLFIRYIVMFLRSQSRSSRTSQPQTALPLLTPLPVMYLPCLFLRTVPMDIYTALVAHVRAMCLWFLGLGFRRRHANENALRQWQSTMTIEIGCVHVIPNGECGMQCAV